MSIHIMFDIIVTYSTCLYINSNMNSGVFVITFHKRQPRTCSHKSDDIERYDGLKVHLN